MPSLEKSKHSSATIRRAVVAVLGAAGVGTCLPLATANAADQPVLTEVVVTGSILRRTDLETPSPMTIVSAETMEERGLNTVSEAIQRLSANNAVHSRMAGTTASTSPPAPTRRRCAA